MVDVKKWTLDELYAFLDIRFTSNFEEAVKYKEKGFEPIECAFGSQGSVLGSLDMDHHGSESWREGVAIRACRDFYGKLKGKPRFVVTGTPDADAVMAIIALSALVPQENIPEGFYLLVNQHDQDPIHMELLNCQYGEELLAFQQIERLGRDSDSFYRAILVMCEILTEGLPPEKRSYIRYREEKRIDLANKGISKKIHPSVLFVQSRVWGFDVWYKYAPVVVSYSQRFESVTIGCIDVQKAESLFGEGGLLNVFRQLGSGWGGREAIGGSPRGEKVSLSEAYFIADKVAEILETSKYKVEP